MEHDSTAILTSSSHKSKVEKRLSYHDEHSSSDSAVVIVIVFKSAIPQQIMNIIAPSSIWIVPTSHVSSDICSNLKPFRIWTLARIAPWRHGGQSDSRVFKSGLQVISASNTAAPQQSVEIRYDFVRSGTECTTPLLLSLSFRLSPFAARFLNKAHRQSQKSFLSSSSSLARSSAQVSRSHRSLDSRLSQRAFLIKPTVNPKSLPAHHPQKSSGSAGKATQSSTSVCADAVRVR